MNRNRYFSRYIGALFLVAMAASIAGNGLLLPIIGDADYLAGVFASETKIRIAGILMLVNSTSVVGIGVLMYPILRHENNFVAISYIATRTIESVVLIVGIICIFSLITIAQEHANKGGF